MRISSAILILLTVLFSLNLPAQSAAKVLFFNQYLEASDSLSAKFSALLMQEGQHWKFTLKKIGSDTVLMQGSYLDADMQIADGLHEFWYEDGAKKNEEGYSKGKANGIWKSWDEYERITDSSIYRDGDHILYNKWTYYDNDSVNMYHFADVPGKRSIIKYHFEEGGLKDDIEFYNDKEIERKSYYENGQLKIHIVRDKKGKQVSVKRFSESGKEISEKEYDQMQKENANRLREAFVQRIPEFNGGGVGFQFYLNQHLKIPDRVIRENIYVDEIVIKFHLNEKGRAYNIIIGGVNDSDLKDAVERFFERMPSWDMKGLRSYGPLTYKIKVIHR